MRGELNTEPVSIEYMLYAMSAIRYWRVDIVTKQSNCEGVMGCKVRDVFVGYLAQVVPK